MVEVRFELEGEDVPQDKLRELLGDNIKLTTLFKLRQNIQQRLGEMCCSQHQAQPEVTIIVSAAEPMKLRVNACCQEFGDQVTHRLEE